MKIPRWSGQGSRVSHMEIHGFAYASIQVYASCIYIRLILFSGSIESNFLVAKTKVTQLNSQNFIHKSLSTRGIHYKFFHSRNAVSFLAVFDRSVARRGIPSTL